MVQACSASRSTNLSVDGSLVNKDILATVGGRDETICPYPNIVTEREREREREEREKRERESARARKREQASKREDGERVTIAYSPPSPPNAYCQLSRMKM